VNERRAAPRAAGFCTLLSFKEVRMAQASFGRRGRLPVAAALLLGALALALGSTAAPRAAAGTKKTYTKVTAKATKPDAEGRQTVTVTMAIEKPWHAYANPVGLPDFEGNRTEVKIASKGGKLEDVKIQYPRGKEEKDAVVGNYRIYEDKVTITGQVRRARGDTGPLEVTVKYVTCNPKGQCLPPETVKLTVP
jgi:thiol:disulfide interchange protein